MECYWCGCEWSADCCDKGEKFIDGADDLSKRMKDAEVTQAETITETLPQEREE